MVGAALPEAPAVAGDISNQLVLIGEVHLPDERPVTENPHPSLAFPPWWLAAAAVAVPSCVVSELLSCCCRQGTTTFRTQETGCAGASPHSLLGGAKHIGACSSRGGFPPCLSHCHCFVCLFRVFGSTDFLSAKQWIFQQPQFITLPFLRCVWSEDYSTHNPFSVVLMLGVFTFFRREEKRGRESWVAWSGYTETNCLWAPYVARRKTFLML